MNNIPRWNLDSIYPDINSQKYKDALAELEQGIKKLNKLNAVFQNKPEDFDVAKGFFEFFQTDDKIAPLAHTLSAYSYSIYSTDTTNKEFLDNLNAVEKAINDYEIEFTDFSHTLAQNSKHIPEFFSRYPEYKKYEFFISECLENDRHVLASPVEKMISALQQTGGKAWDRLHEQLISTLKDEQTGKLFNELRNDAYSANSGVRKTAWQKEVSLLTQNRISFAACLNNLKGETTTLLKERSWNSSIDRALFSSRMKKETLDALISAIEESLADWRKYLCAKAEFLKKNNATASTSCGNSQGIAFYDLFAPLPDREKNAGSLFEKCWTFNEAKEYIIKEFSSFSDKMGNFAKTAFEKNWIDAEIHPGKVGGAYCQDFYVQKESRVLSNFTGTFSDIITLAHELGHAFHFYCIKEKDFRNALYPMTLAETASTFAETIVKQDILKSASDSDKLKILELDLQDTCQVLVDILCRFYFERSVFEERKKGELTADDFCRLMKDAQEKSYGNGLNNERHEYMWAVKSHYYSIDLDFYNFPYAFGQLFSAALYARYKKEGKNFVDVYCELLSDTGSMTCEDLCKKAGFDITKKEFWKTGIDMYVSEIEQFCKVVCQE